MKSAFLLLPVCLFCLLSCGSDFSSPSGTMETFLKAAQDGDEETYLLCLEKSDREWIQELSEKAGKEEDESQHLPDEDSIEDYSIGEEKIDGDKATVKVTATTEGKEQTTTFNLVKVDGEWKIDMIPDELKKMGEVFEGFGKEFEKGMEEMMEGVNK